MNALSECPVLIDPGCPTPRNGRRHDFLDGVHLFLAGCPLDYCINPREQDGWIAAERDATPQERQHAERMAAEYEWYREVLI